MSRSRLAAIVALLTIATASSASAEVAYLNIDLGGLVGVPPGQGTTQLGGAVSMEVGAVLFDRLQVGGRSRFAWTTESIHGTRKKGAEPQLPLPTYTGSNFAVSASVSIAYLPLVRPRIRLGVGASAGYGIWAGCVRGDYCGGRGAIVGVEARAYMPVGRVVNLHATFEFLAQLGMVNGVNPLLLPTLWLGVGF